MARRVHAHAATMNNALAAFLAVAFGAQVVAVIALIWALWKGRIEWSRKGAREIFLPGELGHAEMPAAPPGHELDSSDPAARPDLEGLESRTQADRSSRPAVLAFVGSAVVWLVLGSLAGLVASLELTFPDWITTAAFSFGRLRALHLNAVIYGWTSMAGIGVSLWLLPRLLRTQLAGAGYARKGALLWNIGVAVGLVAVASGWTDGLEWLEFPWIADMILVVAGAVVAIPLFLTLARRRTEHLYVSVLYITAAFLWFPVLFFIANLPGVHFGVEHGITNWWFAHNVLGLWLTPLGLGAAYYFIPKVLGRPIYSYGLSLLGFWSLALFYSQVGAHHLIGGPVPTWLVNLSIVTSVMMVVPVVAVAINHHVTVWGRRKKGSIRKSPTLRFIVVGAMLYTFTSVEGSLQSIRLVNRLTHFTHFTVAHAHAGVYGFVALILFGSLYFIVPRMTGREWPYPRLITAHFWLAVLGILIYVVGLSVGGVLQGMAMLDPDKSFADSVLVTVPYLHLRTVGGGMMTLSHLLFAIHLWKALRPSAEEELAR